MKSRRPLGIERKYVENNREDKQHKGPIWEDWHPANRSPRKIMKNKGEEIIKDIVEEHFLKLKEGMCIILKEDKGRHILKCQATAD